MAKYPSDPPVETETKVVKKGGILGKIVALLLGFILGFVSFVGALIGAGYFVVSQPVKDTVDKLDASFPDLGIGTLLFGGTNSEGEEVLGYINEIYSTGTVLEMLTGISADATAAFTGNGNLNNLAEISPKLHDGVAKLLESTDKLGVPLEKDELMKKPFAAENEGTETLAKYVERCFYETELGDLLRNQNDNDEEFFSDDILMALCYGKENVDYMIKTVDGVKDVYPLNGKKFTTLNDLLSGEVVHDICLSDLMEPSHDDILMMYLVYGKEDIHYAIDPATDTVYFLPKRYALDSENNLYNEYGEAVTFGTYDNEKKTHTLEDGTVYKLVEPIKDSLGNSEVVRMKTADGKPASDGSGNPLYAELYYVDNISAPNTRFAFKEIDGTYHLYDDHGLELVNVVPDIENEKCWINNVLYAFDGPVEENGVQLTVKVENEDGTTFDAPLYYGNPVYAYYDSTHLEDLMNADNPVIENLTSRLTLGEIVGEDTLSGNTLLKHLSDETIDTLSDAIDDLTLLQVFEDKVYQTDSEGNFLDKNGNVTTDPDEYVVTGEWWYLLHNPDVCEQDHVDCDGTCIEDYPVSGMTSMISNMRNNVSNSSLYKLKEDGMISSLDSNTMNQRVEPKILTQDITAKLTEKGIPWTTYKTVDDTQVVDKEVTLGNLTVEQLLDYMSIVFDTIGSIPST